MVRVIQEKPVKAFRARCDKCNSLLEFTADDQSVDQYNCIHVHCPVCNIRTCVKDGGFDYRKDMGWVKYND